MKRERTLFDPEGGPPFPCDYGPPKIACDSCVVNHDAATGGGRIERCGLPTCPSFVVEAAYFTASVIRHDYS